VLPKGSKTKTTGLGIDITLGFLGFGLGLQLSTILARLIMENKCNLVGIPIVMRFGRV